MFEDISVQYIDHMGDDLRVANAARVSMGKWKDEFTTGDERLVGYLARHNHWTPFGHCIVSLREKVPIFVARQRFKHTVGFVYNEVSRRYVDAPPTFYITHDWRKRAETVKQGSGDSFSPEEQEEINRWVLPEISMLEDLYNHLLKKGVAPEQARMVLPQSMMTEYIVTGSLYAWARAYHLRSDSHAQKEIRYLASLWNDIIQPLFPTSWKELINA